MALLVVDEALLDVEQAWTSVFYLKSFDMDSVQVGKAVFGKEIFTTLGIEPRTYSYPGRSGNPCSVCWVKKGVGWRELETPGPIDRTPEPPGSGKNYDAHHYHL